MNQTLVIITAQVFGHKRKYRCHIPPLQRECLNMSHDFLTLAIKPSSAKTEQYMVEDCDIWNYTLW